MDIPKICQNLEYYTQQINKVSTKLIQARIEETELEAKYLQAKDDAFKSRVDSMSSTALNQWITSDTLVEKIKLVRAQCTTKNLQTELNVLETANNNLKMKARLTDIDIKNLSAQ